MALAVGTLLKTIAIAQNTYLIARAGAFDAILGSVALTFRAVLLPPPLADRTVGNYETIALAFRTIPGILSLRGA